MRELRPKISLAVAVLGALETLACSSSNGGASTPESQTLIQVAPEDFIVDGACGDELASYVATLFDVTGPAGLSDAGVSGQSFVVASTPPKGCDESTVFSNVVSGHAYMVELQGYTLLPDEIHPAESGSPAMLSSDGSYLTPTWTASCYGWRDRNGNEQPGYAYAYVTMTLRTCSRLGSKL
jgi:hypothetical protein